MMLSSAFVDAGDNSSNTSLLQVSFNVEDIGKHRATSKKKVTWVFQTGEQQQVVVLVWAKQSGKHNVLINGKEEWFGRKKGSSVISHQWETSGEQYHVFASSVTPTGMKNRGEGLPPFRKYDLLINGRLFANLPFSQNGDRTNYIYNDQESFGRQSSSIFAVLYPDGYCGNA